MFSERQTERERGIRGGGKGRECVRVCVCVEGLSEKRESLLILTEELSGLYAAVIPIRIINDVTSPSHVMKFRTHNKLNAMKVQVFLA